MKVLHISNNDFGGAGLCCLRIHQSLLAAGVESRMVVLEKRQNVEGEFQYGKKRGRLKLLFSRLLRMIGLEITDWDRINSLAEKYNSFYSLPVSSNNLTRCDLVGWADIIHLHWVNDYLDYPSFLRKVEKPIVWTLHDEGFFYGIAHLNKTILLNHPLEKKYRKIKYDAITSAKNLTIVFLSQMMYEKFGSEKIIEGRNKVIIHNLVDPSVYYPKDKNMMRKKHGLDLNKKLFVFISTNINSPNKGLDLFSEALYNVDSNAQILAIGSNPLNKVWRNVISVGLVSGQEEICELICCADYLAMPSFQEAFSQSLVEAMACGIPVVAFPVSGVDEVVSESCGVVCDDFTVSSLMSAIAKVENRDYDPTQIREHIISLCSPEVISGNYIKLYQRLINKELHKSGQSIIQIS